MSQPEHSSGKPLQSTLFHVHDPMCSWCWGYRKTWDQLRARLPSGIALVNIVGGLAPDSDEPMPQDMQNTIAGYWRQVNEQTGAQFNFDFWDNCQPRRSTYPACRAIIAATNQGGEQAMIDAIQHAYYLRAMNPSDDETLITLAVELGLDEAQFESDLLNPHTLQAMQADFAQRRRLGVYSFPSLVLECQGTLHPLEINYHDYRPTLAAIESLHQSRL
ncbi:MAG: DsbA family protein [Halioglobus sp.]